MRKKEDLVSFSIVLFFIAGFFFLIYFNTSVTGFVVYDFEIDEVDGEIDVIVSLKDKSSYSDKDTIKSQQDKFVKLNNLKLKNDYDNINAVALKVNKNDLKKIIKDPNVKSINLDYEFRISLDVSKSVIDADLIWDKLSKNVNLTGSGSVCVLDTGVDYNHPNLDGRIILGPDYVNSDSDPMDDHGHGTHVAGIITSNNSLYKGIANSANVAAVKVMNSGGGGDGGDIINGIDWCINNKDNYNITAISMSIGVDLFDNSCDSTYPLMTDIINSAVGNGILVISSSGNDYGVDSLSLPACITNVTSVGAVNDADSIYSPSNSASFLDVLAPGVNIISTKKDGGFITSSGTSMAAPHASALVPIIKQYSDLESLNLSCLEIKNVIKNNGENVTDSRNGFVFPRINIYKALLSLDSFEPEINFYYFPLEVYDDKSVTLFANVSDTFLDSVWLDYDSNTYYVDEKVLSSLSIGENVSFKFSANDSAGNSAEKESSFIVLDGTPVMNDIQKLTAKLNKPFNYQVVVVDPTNDNLSYSDDTDLFNITQDGLISFTADSLDNYTINISVSDSTHDIFDVFDLEVVLNNSKPNITSHYPLDSNLEINENESLEFSITKEDLDDVGLSVGWYVNGNLVDNQDEYLFETNYSSSGNYNISIIISDGIDTDSFEWNLVVNNVDLVPIFTGLIENISFDENTNYSLDLKNYFVDLDGDELDYNISNIDNISVNIDNGVVTLEPDLEFNCNVDVRFYGSDIVTNYAESNLVNLEIRNVPVCGNNLVEDGEECDGSDLDGNTCISKAYDSGSLGCGSECKFDYTNCVINPSSSGTPSGGGGTPINEEEETIEEETESVEEELKASSEEESSDGITGEVVKEEALKPKISRIKTVFIKIGGFFKKVWYKIVSFIKP